MQKQFVCMICPKSCVLTVNVSEDSFEVEGNQCKYGIAFAEQEITDPQRVMTTTVKLTTGALLPVKSKGTVKKQEVKAIVRKLKSTVISPPVTIGEIVACSIGDNKVDIMATDSAL